MMYSSMKKLVVTFIAAIGILTFSLATAAFDRVTVSSQGYESENSVQSDAPTRFIRVNRTLPRKRR